MTYAETVLDARRERQALVPSLWALEVCNVIVRAEAKGLLTEARSQAFVVLLERLNIATDSATAAHAWSDTLHLARRYKLSANDAAYLDLALRTDRLTPCDAGRRSKEGGKGRGRTTVRPALSSGKTASQSPQGPRRRSVARAMQGTRDRPCHSQHPVSRAVWRVFGRSRHSPAVSCAGAIDGERTLNTK